MATIQKIIPNLWFNNNAEEAVDYYVSIFENSKIGRMARYTDEGFEYHGKTAGTPMTIELEIEGQTFVALNGGDEFKFTEAVSFIVYCDTQKEIDYYWNRLTPGGDPQAQMCGWLKYKYGVSWQIVSTVLPHLVTDADSTKSERVMKALMSMKKLDIEILERAYHSEQKQTVVS
ncbi:MAG: VOC family protein [Chitinophagaceae bacterium]